MSKTAAGLMYEDAGSGPPLVLVHAYPQCREQWKPQLAGLADVARVIAPDAFGFGGTTLPAAGWSVDTMADALAAFLLAAGVSGPVVLGGLSMGGYIALAFARRHPDRLRGLILADTKAEPDNVEGKAARDKAIAFARANTAAAVFEQMLPKALGDTTRNGRPDVVAEAKRIAGAQSVDGITAALAALRDRPDATPGLAKISVPTLVIVGSEDAITPPDVGRTMAAAIPGARLEEIPAAGHLSNLEAPDAFNAAVRAFLAGL